MRPLHERRPVLVGTVFIALVAVAVVGALQYHRLPIFNMGHQFSAYFVESAGLRPAAKVRVSGLEVGEVDSVDLDGSRVKVTFTVDKGIAVGNRTEAAIKTKSLLGTKVLEVTPRGDGQLSEPIPTERTSSPYQLPDALAELNNTIRGLETNNLSQSLSTMAETFSQTPPDLKIAIAGAARLASTLDARDTQLRALLADAQKVSSVLANRSDQIVNLLSATNALLAELRAQSDALDHIAGNITALAHQLQGFVQDNREQFGPMLDHLNTVMTVLDNRKAQIQKSLNMVNPYLLALGESLSAGPFFKTYIVNLLPGQFLQPFIDAAFSDLGLDPNVLLPSQLSDPPTGQPATPPLPVPYPRTGQGGEPRRTLPDAITGNPGDQRYPYREPPPAPAPGGPPPGPPAIPPGGKSATEPTPRPVYVPAPNEVAPSPVPGPSATAPPAGETGGQ
ncbi:MCE family protein [Mycobacterium sp. 1465703.0]|uniref:MCE family protein n=1 Tax=Mycobacterium sp. 1465703.0 TaxID=1834078 RepID=UPI0007FF7CBE|nr:MCE family protein [Mycobacterium sp. 1465703.0]OBJ08852.1 mammalian cell entry protein [Mycobacterium sp. 1465703.0]